jgi:hypothetical protein
MLTMPDGTETSAPQSKCDRQFNPHSCTPVLLPSPFECVAQPGQSQFSPHVHAPSTTSSCVGNDSGSSPSISIAPSSIGSTLTPAFFAISSKLDMPGKPTADRLISVAVLPSGFSAADRNLCMSAKGLSLRLRTDEPDMLRLEDAEPRRRCPDSSLEYGEYSLVLCTCRLVCAG